LDVVAVVVAVFAHDASRRILAAGSSPPDVDKERRRREALLDAECRREVRVLDAETSKFSTPDVDRSDADKKFRFSTPDVDGRHFSTMNADEKSKFSTPDIDKNLCSYLATSYQLLLS
jgi:hypothetical protein